MSAARKKAKRIRDLRTLVSRGQLSADEANHIGAKEGLGTIVTDGGIPRSGRPQPGPWAQEQAVAVRKGRA